MSLAVFALVVVIWVALLVPIARRGRAELAWEASEGGSRLSGGARPWTTGNLLAEPADDEPEAEAAAARLARRRAARRRAATRRRRVLLLLVVATAAGSRVWAVLGGRWWLAAAAVTGLLLAGYLLTLAGLGWRRSRRRRARTAARPGRAARWPRASWGGQVPVSTE